MTPSQIIALVRDALVVVALGFCAWKLYSAGEDHVTAKDLKAVQTQVENNAKTTAQWAQEARDAEIKRQGDMDKVSASIAAQRAPIVLRLPSGTGAVSGTPTGPPSGTACPGGSPAGSGVDTDIRQAIDGFELKYEKALAQCRSVLASWPH